MTRRLGDYRAPNICSKSSKSFHVCHFSVLSPDSALLEATCFEQRGLRKAQTEEKTDRQKESLHIHRTVSTFTVQAVI